MKKDDKNLRKLINEWIRLDYIRPEDVPNIELYMDQVTTFMDSQLENTKRFDSDKTLTKTMINNYTKNDLLPPPVKKKYSKEHIYLLIYIYYFKSCLSIGDIQQILQPMIENICDDNDKEPMDKIYQSVFETELGHFKDILMDVERTHALSKTMFADCDEKDKDYLEDFGFMALLSYDVYIKKKILEKMIDTYYPGANSSDGNEKAKEKSKAELKAEAKARAEAKSKEKQRAKETPKPRKKSKLI